MFLSFIVFLIVILRCITPILNLHVIKRELGVIVRKIHICSIFKQKTGNFGVWAQVKCIIQWRKHALPIVFMNDLVWICSILEKTLYDFICRVKGIGVVRMISGIQGAIDAAIEPPGSAITGTICMCAIRNGFNYAIEIQIIASVCQSLIKCFLFRHCHIAYFFFVGSFLKECLSKPWLSRRMVSLISRGGSFCLASSLKR